MKYSYVKERHNLNDRDKYQANPSCLAPRQEPRNKRVSRPQTDAKQVANPDMCERLVSSSPRQPMSRHKEPTSGDGNAQDYD